jgi:hypothetical protein
MLGEIVRQNCLIITYVKAIKHLGKYKHLYICSLNSKLEGGLVYSSSSVQIWFLLLLTVTKVDASYPPKLMHTLITLD